MLLGRVGPLLQFCFHGAHRDRPNPFHESHGTLLSSPDIFTLLAWTSVSWLHVQYVLAMSDTGGCPVYSFPTAMGERQEALAAPAPSRFCSINHIYYFNHFSSSSPYPSLSILSLSLPLVCLCVCVCVCVCVNVCVRSLRAGVCMYLLEHVLMADPAHPAPAPVEICPWDTSWMFKVDADPRAGFLGPGARHYDSMTAVEERWSQLFGIPLLPSTIDTNEEPTAAEEKKKKKKKKKKKTSLLSSGRVDLENKSV
jgi:hypothetical protein